MIDDRDESEAQRMTEFENMMGMMPAMMLQMMPT